MDTSATSREHTPYHAIFLSPHLDDAILSCGGTINQLAQKGKQVLIVTVMAGDPPPGALSPFTAGLHGRWQLTVSAAASRRSEDLLASQSLGALCRHLDFPDCIYRRSMGDGQHLYQSDEALFGEIHSSEIGLVEQIGRSLELIPKAEVIYTPLTIGNHVDHQLVRMAAEATFLPTSLCYYEEYPYSESPVHLDLCNTSEESWNHQIVQLDGDDVKARIVAVSCYKSQISTFFDSLADVDQRIRRNVELIGGERFWRPGN